MKHRSRPIAEHPPGSATPRKAVKHHGRPEPSKGPQVRLDPATQGAQVVESTWRRPYLEPRPVECDGRVHSIFYGYPATLIAEWCSVSPEVAQAWKDGTSEPSRQELKLFALYVNGQVVPPEFRGFKFHKGILYDPQGQPFSPSLLQGYAMIWQYASDLARQSGNPNDRERFFELLQLAG